MAFKKSSDFSYKDSTDVVSADLSHIGQITRRKFKNSGLDGFEYFTSLETMKNNNSHMMVVTATPRAILHSSLKKFVDDKNLYIVELMNTLEAFTPEESIHFPTCPPDFDPRNKDVEESLAKSKFQKEKQSASVTALSFQQLQVMLTNVIRAQYDGTPQSSLYYSKPYTRRIDCLSMPTNYQPPKLQQFDDKRNPRQHIPHFVETCSNVETHVTFWLKKLFVR
ncbi:hypothetical protein R3W88_014951 [Solanum pinnatisectum]|uniref:Uncharacterized protein n=1 Tax=Solanum pinnatisectum TaxID=50273 RepID=A0AAV9KTW1_9SOLN|nr:hypothetical protein R3W88_014951 [Solanum pinnatisectum]